jgi:single-strand DNA-binding protein
MCRNHVVLAGYLVRDAESRSGDGSTPYVVLTLVTKSSWRDKTGEWKTHSECHRCVAWGARFADIATLKRGAHLQIEGELRSREYEKNGNTQRISEIRVGTVARLQSVWGQPESVPVDADTASAESSARFPSPLS